MYDENFYEGAGVVDGEGGNGERWLKWGGGPWGGHQAWALDKDQRD